MKKILLVEDDPLLIDIYATKLKQESDFDVMVAQDGEKALRVIEEFLPDLVLLDIVLPHCDGWDVLENVRKNEKWKNVKVVIFSNLGQKEEIEKGKNLGADLYLIKAHYTPSQVVEEIKKLLML